MKKKYYRTWIEISQSAIKNNAAVFRNLIGPKVKLMSVVKSNAYGHGLFAFAPFAEKYVDWFGVDSIAEALALRKYGIKKPILVLGYTLPNRYGEAQKNNISLTFYNFEEIKYLRNFPRLKIHLKIDTGMHRQGIYIKNLPAFLKIINLNKIEGVYTHFAGAKDKKFKFYTLEQMRKFKEAKEIFKNFRLDNILFHGAATAAVINYPESHYNMVRIGFGLYGLYQSPLVKLKPVLSWKTIIAQIKEVRKGDLVGYNLIGKIKNNCQIAVFPVGYWHGLDRGLSDNGEVLIKSKRTKILGIISMDMAIALLPKGLNIKLNDNIVLIGKSGKNEIKVRDISSRIDTIDYEIITRINPLIPRILIK